VLVEGRGWYAWIERHAPFDAATTRRFALAFEETGRGLAFGILGAGFVQSVVATIAYVVLDVPAALPLGLITLVFSVIPAIGTALVWAPVAAGLALSGRIEAAIALGVIGVAVISTVDNLARPYLARLGQLQLPTWVVLVAMFGGIEVIGGWGLIMGPLLVRLAKEGVLVASAAKS
jgi:predicted PurR-regulated permease PerM